MRNYIVLALVLLLFSCSGLNKVNQDHSDTSYLIKNIKSKNDWHIIYAVRNDSLFKIVVKKEASGVQGGRKIIAGQYYNLVLHSRRENAPVIDGIKIRPINYLDIQCYTYDKNTTICIEPRKGILDLYHAENIKGLYFIEKSIGY